MASDKAKTKSKTELSSELRDMVLVVDQLKALEIEHARMLRKLTASEIRYRRLFETAQDGILILEAESGVITDVNPFLTEMLGYSREYF